MRLTLSLFQRPGLRRGAVCAVALLSGLLATPWLRRRRVDGRSVLAFAPAIGLAAVATLSLRLATAGQS